MPVQLRLEVPPICAEPQRDNGLASASTSSAALISLTLPTVRLMTAGRRQGMDRNDFELFPLAAQECLEFRHLLLKHGNAL